MSEITKLYENAGVEYGSCQNYSRFEECCNSPFCDSGMCPNGTSGEKHPFTAEKQLELIKIFAKRELTIDNTDYEFSFSISDGDEFAYTYITKKYFNSFENALANLTNTLWQSLTPAEKQQIKEILE